MWFPAIQKKILRDSIFEVSTFGSAPYINIGNYKGTKTPLSKLSCYIALKHITFPQWVTINIHSFEVSIRFLPILRHHKHMIEGPPIHVDISLHLSTARVWTYPLVLLARDYCCAQTRLLPHLTSFYLGIFLIRTYLSHLSSWIFIVRSMAHCLRRFSRCSRVRYPGGSNCFFFIAKFTGLRNITYESMRILWLLQFLVKLSLEPHAKLFSSLMYWSCALLLPNALDLVV